MTCVNLYIHGLQYIGRQRKIIIVMISDDVYSFCSLAAATSIACCSFRSIHFSVLSPIL